MKKKKKIFWLIVLILCVLAVIFGSVLIIRSRLASPAIRREDVTPTSAVEATEPSDETTAPTAAPTEPAIDKSFGYELADIGDLDVDFDHLKSINTDIYAWLYIPNTNVDYPVVRGARDEDDFFYLDHNATGEPDNNGAIYTEMCNSKNMDDPVTVIYGHNMNLSGAMLNQMLLFEDEDFFNENEYFEIYTPGHILRYRIISAYVSDDRHIMNSFDFSNETTREEYFDFVCDPRSLAVNSREGVKLESTDKIVQISTCTSVPGLLEARYLLTGVLIEDSLTK